MSNYAIELQNQHDYAIDEERLLKALEHVLMAHKQTGGTNLTVVVADNAFVKALNTTHRGIEAPTDVLSFPSDIPPALIPDAPYLGDLVIAYPYAKAQAEKHQHDLQDSLCLLVVHGCLHLLGYDHDTPDNKASMWAMQASILQGLGIDTQIVPALEG
jgi:probable rRNA maturation factor